MPITLTGYNNVRFVVHMPITLTGYINVRFLHSYIYYVHACMHASGF